MGDLSDLLHDVYGSPAPATAPDAPDPDGPPVAREPAAAERRPPVPEWAGEDRLDAAFADWTPGPQAGASRHERELVEAATEAGDGDLAAALSAVLASAPADEPGDGAPAGDAHPVSSLEARAVAAIDVRPIAGFDVDDAVDVRGPAELEVIDLHDEEIGDEEASEPVPMPVAARWQRDDDDILPDRAGRRRLFRRR